MRVSIDCEGNVKGLNRVLNAVLGWRYEELGFEQADKACTEFGRLVREISELAWICRRGSECGFLFGYAVDVYVTEKGITWQLYRTRAAPPPPAPFLMPLGAALAMAIGLVGKVLKMSNPMLLRRW